MKKINEKFSIVVLLAIFAIMLNSCEDAAPTEYLAEPYVEGYLIVDKPIEAIMIYQTQPLNSVFNLNNAIVRNAEVTITVDGIAYPLQYRATGNRGYAYADESVKVLPQKEYFLNIKMPDGSIITSSTVTPRRFEWVREPKPIFHFPQDTVKLPQIDSLDIEWTPVPEQGFFLIRVTCKDTLEYGKYLTPATSEMNRRTHNIMDKFDETFYNNLSTWGFVANTLSPNVWISYKWFGPHNVSILSPDKNMLDWFINVQFTQSTQTHEKLNSVKGAIGVFGSASLIEKDIFLMKNQP